MANISSASGKLYITASSIAECEEIYKFINILTDKWSYEFRMYDELTVHEVIDSCNEESDDEVTMETSFYADGKWSFQTNAELFGVWLQNAELIDPTSKVKAAINMLSKIKFVLEFQFDEDEPGCGFIGVGNVRLAHLGNTALSDSKVLDTELESHDLTVENLVAYRGFNEGYAQEYLGEDY